MKSCRRTRWMWRAADFTPDRQHLNPIEIASRDEIAALQLRRMKWSLRHAYENVPHYKKAFDAAGVHPDDLKDLSDLRRFPLTSKDDLRANYPYGMFAVPMDKIVRIHASSGTTGKPTVVGYTKLDIRTWADVCARSIFASGGRPGMKIHNAYGYGLFTGGAGGSGRAAGGGRGQDSGGAASLKKKKTRDRSTCEPVDQ